MIDFKKVPVNVSKLATTCLLSNINLDQLLQMDVTFSTRVANEAGLTMSEYIECLRWAGEWLVKHVSAQHSAALERLSRHVAQQQMELLENAELDQTY